MSAVGPHLTGLLLAGGKALRLGGNKASLDLAGTSLLERGAALAHACCDELLLLAGDRGLQLPGVRCLADWPGVAGPLAGLAAGLAAAKNPWSLLLPCDQPFVTVELVRWLQSRLEAVASSVSPVAVVFQDDHG
ncbi:MAG: molybdopterin-guanine dinucleotide biosynthesis protein A, partial [Pseudohongiellaceae bacterium]